jgi:hypothetical protein
MDDPKLAFYMNFESNVLDWGSSNLHGTKANSTDYVTGTIGSYAIDFDNTVDEGILCSGSLDKLGNDEISIAFWLYWDGTISGAQDTILYIGNGSTRSGTDFIEVGSDTNDTLLFQIKNVEYQHAYASGYQDKWTHIVYTYNYTGDELKVYLDGVLMATSTMSAVSSNYPSTLAVLSLGYIEGTASLQAGMQVDEFRIYNKILSQNEITNLNGGLTAQGYSVLNAVSITSPNIQLLDDDYGDTAENVPDIFIGEEELLRIDPYNGTRTETFTLRINIIIENYTLKAPYLIKSTIREIDKLLDTESHNHTSYYYTTRYRWPGSFRIGKSSLLIEVKNALVTRPSLV